MEKRYVEVIVDVAHSSVDKIFDYELPGNLAAQEGSRILVPFGRMQVEGIVLAVKENTELPPKKIRAVQRVIDEQPIVGSEQILLAKYMCVKYHTTMAFCLRLMYPAKMRGERIRPKTVRMAAILDEEKAVEEQAKCYTKEGVVRAKNRLRTIETLRAGKTPLHFSMLPLCGICEKKASSRCARSRSSALPMGAWKQKQKYRLKCGSKARYFGNKLRGRGWGKKTFLLHGVTGSGKTEVYIACVKRALECGKSAIVLVPEISLTPQMLGEFARHFPGEIAVFHSGLSDGERFDEWRRLREGAAHIILGARSAIFMPVKISASSF